MSKQINKKVKTPNSLPVAEDEQILYTAKVGRKIIGGFAAIVVLCLGLAGLILFLGFQAVSKHIHNAWLIFVAGGLLAVIGFCLPFYCRSVLNRKYIITNRRLVVEQGGKMLRGRRMLSLDNINGIDVSNNLLMSIFDACSIDFYSPGVQSRVTTFLIFSFAKTTFKFHWIAREDGEAIYKLFQQIIK